MSQFPTWLRLFMSGTRWRHPCCRDVIACW